MIYSFIKLLGINLCICYSYFKIINFKCSAKSKKIIIILITVILSLISSYLKETINPIIVDIMIYLILNLSLCLLTKTKYGYSLIIMIISLSLNYIMHIFSATLVTTFESLMKINILNSIFLVLVNFANFTLTFLFFKIRRFKNGFKFIINNKSNDYFDIFILIISSLIIYMYFMFGNYYKIHPKYLFYEFILTTIILFTVIQKTFIMYQKQKLYEKTLKEYEQEIKEKDEKIHNLLTEESRLVKANHEFFHRQEALKHKLIDLKATNKNFNEEYGEIISRIDKISEEYENLTKDSNIKHNLPKCYVTELDDMFSYMQSECEKNNIEFILKINGNIHSLINNIIPKSRLETLIGDLIRNSIIAINHSDKKFRSIMAILGIKNEYFEFCIYDTGIEFELDTLSKLGIEKASTHLDTGGTGIGFITTFETLRKCNASIIINEISPLENNYTKSITICFNDKFEYIINSYRETEISNICKNRNDLILNSNFIH